MIRPISIDLPSHALSSEERFVLSQVTGLVSFPELIAVSGMDAEKLHAIVDSLVARGALEIVPEARRDTLRSGAEWLDGTPAASDDDTLSDAVADDADGAGVALSVAGVTDVGRSRSNNEDAFAVIDLTSSEVVDLSAGAIVVAGERGVLLAVSDGMGGENAGEVASGLVLDAMRVHLTQPTTFGDAADALASAAHEANARVTMAAEDPSRSGMGATLIAVLIRGGYAVTAEVGDSRAYVLRGGTLTRLSKDQTHVQLLVEQGLLTPEQAQASRAKNVVLQACGKVPELVVAQRRLVLRQDDRLLLCSDGLTLHVTELEIEAVLTSVPSAADACATLVGMANERGGQDNVTVLLADVSGPPPPAEDETVQRALMVVRDFASVESP
jgi:PPM family protein phosphatase